MNHREAREQIGVDVPLWGYAYESHNPLENHTSRKLHCEPVRGIITHGNPRGCGWEFVPLKKDGTPAYSKAVSMYSRRYAATEKEAIKGYNAKIQKIIDRLQEACRRLSEQKITNRVNDKVIEALKKELFMYGIDDIEDFVGTSVSAYEKDTIENLMDEVISQMPDDELEKYIQKYNIKA